MNSVESGSSKMKCPCCGGELVEIRRTVKNVTFKCSQCGVSDTKLLTS